MISKTYQRWMNRYDLCPECRKPLTVYPQHCIPDDAGGFIAQYQCAICGNQWQCSWADEEDD